MPSQVQLFQAASLRCVCVSPGPEAALFPLPALSLAPLFFWRGEENPLTVLRSLFLSLREQSHTVWVASEYEIDSVCDAG